MDQIDAVGPSPNVLVKLHSKDASLPSIRGIKTSLLLAAIRHLVANREMFVVTEISHRLSHQFVISLNRSRSRAVHDANHLIQRVEDSRRLSFLLAEGMSSPKGLDFGCSGCMIRPAGRAQLLNSVHQWHFVCTQFMHPTCPNTVKTTHIDQKSSGSRMIHVVINTNNRDFSSFQHIQRHYRQRTEFLQP